MLPNEFEWYTHLERPIAMFSVEDESETEKRARESPTDTIASLEVEEKDPNSAVCTLFPLESQCGFMWATFECRRKKRRTVFTVKCMPYLC
jgi:hypothetical protein